MSGIMAGQRVLVTGGLGFIGSNLVLELVSQGARVTVVDLPHAGTGANLFNIHPVWSDVELHEIDVRDSSRLAPLVDQQDFIFCLAGQVSHSASMRQPLLDLDVNCRSHLALLEVCRTHHSDARLVFASTRQLYGRPRYLPVDEQHPTCPVDVNGVSKLAAEQLFRLYHENYGIRSVSLRLTNTYGPRMDLGNPEKGFANVFLARALRGDPLVVYGTGEQRRDFNYVTDVVSALLLAATTEAAYGTALNLAHPENHSLNDFVAILSRLLPVQSQQVPFPPERQAIDVGDYYGSFHRMHALTGWSPAVDLSAGLERTVDFFLQHREQYLQRDT